MVTKSERAMNGYQSAMSKYFVFQGRSSRSEYWVFVFVYILIGIAAQILDMFLGTYSPGGEVGLVGALVGLVHLIPSIAVAVRRLHDTDRTGWWLLIILVPLVGFIVLLIFFVLPSTPGKNRFGPPPVDPATA
jgi:uncharacterized membrane protein YhaH (DUF805 family)